jgi:hypothetical protein
MNHGNVLTRRIALFVGGLAVVGMGLTVGCSAKQSPAPNAPADSQVDSKRGAPDGKEGGGKAKQGSPEKVMAPGAATVNPAAPIAPGMPGRH